MRNLFRVALVLGIALGASSTAPAVESTPGWVCGICAPCSILGEWVVQQGPYANGEGGETCPGWSICDGMCNQGAMPVEQFIRMIGEIRRATDENRVTDVMAMLDGFEGEYWYAADRSQLLVGNCDGTGASAVIPIESHSALAGRLEASDRVLTVD